MRGQYTLDYVVHWRLDVHFFIFCFREKSFQNALSFVMDASRADSTVKKYKNAIAAWGVWCRLNKVNPKLADHEDIARYFIWMFNGNAP